MIILLEEENSIKIEKNVKWVLRIKRRSEVSGCTKNVNKLILSLRHDEQSPIKKVPVQSRDHFIQSPVQRCTYHRSELDVSGYHSVSIIITSNVTRWMICSSAHLRSSYCGVSTNCSKLLFYKCKSFSYKFWFRCFINLWMCDYCLV